MTTTFRLQADGISIIDKAPDAVLEYGIDLSANPPSAAWLASGEFIVSQVVTVDSGLTKGTVAATPTGAATAVSVVLSGGTIGTAYLVTIEFTTNKGRTDSRSFRVNVVRR